MHAHERRGVAFQIAANQRDVLILIDVAGVRNHSKIAVTRRQSRFGNTTDVWSLPGT